MKIIFFGVFNISLMMEDKYEENEKFFLIQSL